MQYTSVTSTSLARPNLQASELEEILRAGGERNFRNGITSLLVFNGTHFLQLIEGPEADVGNLVERLRKDARHSGFEVRDRVRVERRSFPDWPMEFVRVRPSFFDAKEAIADKLPESVPEAIRARLLRITELISTIGFAG